MQDTFRDRTKPSLIRFLSDTEYLVRNKSNTLDRRVASA